MEQKDKDSSPAPQLLFLPPQDTTRLLEVYVQRRLSRNEETLEVRVPGAKPHRCPNPVKRQTREGRMFIESVPTEACQLPKATVQQRNKKPCLLKSFICLFSRKTREKRQEAEPEQERLWRNKAMRKPSLRSYGGQEAKLTTVNRPTTLTLSSAGHISNILRVEPTIMYYEKVSEELANIVREVTENSMNDRHVTGAQDDGLKSTAASTEEKLIQKIVEFLKEQGDAIDKKLQDNATLSSFFQKLSYGSFQQLADQYLEAETPELLPPGTGGPELVHFAFTLDFTATLAGLYNNAVGQIMYFANRYLRDRFTQMSRTHSSFSSDTQMEDVDTSSDLD